MISYLLTYLLKSDIHTGKAQAKPSPVHITTLLNVIAKNWFLKEKWNQMWVS